MPAVRPAIFLNFYLRKCKFSLKSIDISEGAQKNSNTYWQKKSWFFEKSNKYWLKKNIAKNLIHIFNTYFLPPHTPLIADRFLLNQATIHCYGIEFSKFEFAEMYLFTCRTRYKIYMWLASWTLKIEVCTCRFLRVLVALHVRVKFGLWRMWLVTIGFTLRAEETLRRSL